MIPSGVLRAAREGFGLPRGHVRVLSTRFGKVCLAHRTHAGHRTQLRLVQAQPDTADRLASEMRWLTHLAARHRLRVPVPMPWQRGGAVSPVLLAGDGSAWHAVACSWVPGRHLNRGLRSADLASVGGLLARMHLANVDAPEGLAAERPTWHIPRLFSLATTLRDLMADRIALPAGVTASLAGALRDAHAGLVAAWSTLPTGPAHEGLIHADAHWQNLRFAREGPGIVDFEDCANGRFLFDVACLWAKVERRRNDATLLDAILEGYHRVRPLPAGATRDLHVMLAFRRFDYAGWVLSWPHADLQGWGPEFLAGTPSYMHHWLGR